jgi:hypothetical protein
MRYSRIRSETPRNSAQYFSALWWKYGLRLLSPIRYPIGCGAPRRTASFAAFSRQMRFAEQATSYVNPRSQLGNAALSREFPIPSAPPVNGGEPKPSPLAGEGRAPGNSTMERALRSLPRQCTTGLTKSCTTDLERCGSRTHSILRDRVWS